MTKDSNMHWSLAKYLIQAAVGIMSLKKISGKNFMDIFVVQNNNWWNIFVDTLQLIDNKVLRKHNKVSLYLCFKLKKYVHIYLNIYMYVFKNIYIYYKNIHIYIVAMPITVNICMVKI